MKQQNAYIQIEIADSIAICHFYPPVEGGMPLPIKEAEDYLSAHGISDFDKHAFRALISGTEVDSMELGVCSDIEFE